MKLSITYFAQLKKEAGKSSEVLAFENEVSLKECINLVSKKYSSQFYEMFFDEHGTYRDAIVLIINSVQVRYAENPNLNDGDELLIMSPIAGG